jgi:hypothetical protein
MDIMADLKLYIAVLDEVPDYMVPTLVAHSVLNAHMKFAETFYDDIYNDRGHPVYMDWLINSFKKVTLRVNRKEFDKIAALDDVHLGHENKTLDGQPSCIVVCPRIEIPNVLKFAKMWAPKQDST